MDLPSIDPVWLVLVLVAGALGLSPRALASAVMRSWAARLDQDGPQPEARPGTPEAIVLNVIQHRMELAIDARLDAKADAIVQRLEAAIDAKLDAKIDARIDAKLDAKLRPIVREQAAIERRHGEQGRNLGELERKVARLTAGTT